MQRQLIETSMIFHATIQNTERNKYEGLSLESTHITGKTVVPRVRWLRRRLLLMMNTPNPSSGMGVVDVFRHHADPVGQATATGGRWARGAGARTSCPTATSAATASASAAPTSLFAALGPRERGFLQQKQRNCVSSIRKLHRV